MKVTTSRLKALLLGGSALFLAQPLYAQTQTAAAPSDVTEEIIVQGRFIPNEIRDTPEVVSVLTAEDLQRSGDDNAASALTRVTGLSLVSGRFVYVRGLGERYSQALLNGSPLPSPEPLQRVVPLDLFPASILASTTVQKTYSARYPGEFGGGVIDLNTVGIPDSSYLNVGVSMGFDTETTGKSGLTYYGSDTDFLGFDNGARKLPAGVRELAMTRPVVATGSSGSLTPAEVKGIARSFNNAPLNLVQSAKSAPGGSFDLAGGHTFTSDSSSIGVVGVLNYRNSWLTRDGVRQTTVPDIGGLTLATDAKFRSTQNDIGWSGLGGLSWLNDDNEVRYTGVWIRSASKRARITENSPLSQGNANVNVYNTEWFERDLYFNQLAGKHTLGEIKVDWRGTYSRTNRDAPYERYYRYGLRADGKRSALLSGANQLVSFSSLTEDSASANVDFTYDLDVSFLRQAQLMAGGAWQNNDRTSSRRDFTYDQGRNWDPARYGTERIDYLVSDQNINDEIVAFRELTGSSLTGDAARYDAALDVRAGYVQIDSEIVPLVRASLGGRYEYAEETIQTFDIFRPQNFLFSRKISRGYFLPAGTLTWNFAEDQQLRAGASKTIGRPQFRELAPQRYRDTETDRILTGNPYLEDTEIYNADLRYEHYYDRGQYFTLGGFYKRLDKPAEALAVLGSDGAFQQTFYNAPRANLFGAEAEGKVYFDLTSGAEWIDSKRWLVAANYTYTKSKLKVKADDVIVLNTTGIRSTPKASDYILGGERMQGQSDHLANVQFGYEDDANDSQATVLVTYTSKRIAARSSSLSLPNLISDPGLRVDFVYRQTFTIRDLAFTGSFEARNLNGAESREYQESNGKRFNTNTYQLGRTLSLGLTAKF